MIISLKDHFKTLFKAIKSPEKFTITQTGITLIPKTSKFVNYSIPTSRFSGISVKVLGLNTDDEVFVRMYGLIDPPPAEPGLKQFESKFTGADNEDNFQGWTYRDSSNTRKLHVEFYSLSTLNVTIDVEIIGETI